MKLNGARANYRGVIAQLESNYWSESFPATPVQLISETITLPVGDLFVLLQLVRFGTGTQ